MAGLHEPDDESWTGLERWIERLRRIDGLEDMTTGQAFRIDRLARRYVRKEGRPLRLVRHIIRQAAESDLHPPQNVLLIGSTGTVVGDDSAAEWTHAKRLPEVATMFVRLGASQCLVCGGQLRDGGSGRRYCSAHEQSASLRERADSEAISALLVAAAEALGVA